MTKIGNDSGARLSGLTGETSRSQGQETSFRRSLERAESMSKPVAIGSASGSSVGSSDEADLRASPPTYDLTRTVTFDVAAQFVANGRLESARELEGLKQGLSNESLPQIAIVAPNSAARDSGIVAVGRTIFIPAPVFQSWQQAGQADSGSAAAFNAAFSTVLSRMVTPNG